MEYIAHKSVWFPSVVRVAGYRLRPPTLGQIRLLEATSSPFIIGGPVDLADVAIALHILSTPWRRARRQIAALWPIALIVRLISRRRALRDPAVADAIHALLDAALWSPDPYLEDGAGARLPCATGLAARLACRAVRLRPDALCHLSSPPFQLSTFSFQLFSSSSPWACVWDIPVAAIMAYSVADAEVDNHEFITRQETKQFSRQPHTPKPSHEQPRRT